MNQQKIAILVDSCTDIPLDLVKKYNLYVVPLKINYRDKEYLDGVDITAEEVYNRLPVEIPKTSLPSGSYIVGILDQIKADGYEKVLAVTISSGLSGTHNVINLIGSEYEGLDIFVLDTKNIGMGSGFNAVQAAEYIEEGMDWDTLIQTVSTNISNSKIFFCVSTLEYLQKGGRIGLVSSILGNVLNLKPIISCNEDGVYYTVAKVRGRKQSIKKAMDIAVEFAHKRKKYNVAISHSNAEEEANQIKEILVPLLPNVNIFTIGQISPALGVHAGPGLIGVGIQLL
ncbi:DegV family protein [Brevibacillus daliensis]|uniref:DegV family protein n=1 Tax=Brevibacillus daliensis TaxID=2892995 RepID=UPI001E4351AD|nr:DegV family protein [Brevibacillus daliensis]